VKPGTVELVIERIVAGGHGLARTPDGVVLVRGALPGERVRARPTMRAGVLRAHASEILEPHPARVVDLGLPPGADLPLRYDVQLEIKHGLVCEALERNAKIDAIDAVVDPVRSSPRELAYRTAAQYVVMDPRGLAARGLESDRLVPLTSDPLVAEPLARAMQICAERTMHSVLEIAFRASLHEGLALAGLIGARSGPFERIARALVDSGIAGVIWAEADERGRFRGRTRLLEGRDSLLEDFGGVRSTVTASSFAQVNPAAAGVLYREAAELAGSAARALDLYAGSGVLGAHLARAIGSVVAIEIDAEAVRRGKADARRARIENLEFHRGDARTAARFLPADVVAVDPPRAGLAQDVVTLFLEHRPQRIVYVSCDPVTWARDVGMLCAGGYTLRAVRPFDFYPYTHHVEVLSLLER